MSWYTTGRVENGAGLDTLEVQGGTQGETPEVKEQVAEAKKAAKQLIESGFLGVVGAPGRQFQVSISGHANARHEPTSEYASDCVTVSISQVNAARGPVDPPRTPHPQPVG